MKLLVNGAERDVEAAPDAPLLWTLRDQIGLTGTKYGCGAGLCGACLVHLDGRPTKSCLVSTASAAGRKIVTIEGVSGRAAEAVQSAWRRLDVTQCGYCQSGQIMSAIALLERRPAPSDADLDKAMNGNLCRCGTYQRIRAAIREAAKSLG